MIMVLLIGEPRLFVRVAGKRVTAVCVSIGGLEMFIPDFWGSKASRVIAVCVSSGVFPGVDSSLVPLLRNGNVTYKRDSTLKLA